jgi:hypothetical protein
MKEILTGMQAEASVLQSIAGKSLSTTSPAAAAV